MIRTGFDGAVRGDGFPYIQSGVLDDLLIRQTARFSDVVLDLGCVEQHPEIRAALRAAGKSTLWAYVVLRWWGVDQYSPRFFQEFKGIIDDTHGVCWGTDGDPLGWWLSNVNLANPATVAGLGQLIAHYAQPWDGVFLDTLLSEMPIGQTDVDYQRNGYATMALFKAAWDAGVAALRAAIPKPVTGNYGPTQQPSYNGNMFEELPTQPPGMGWAGIIKTVQTTPYAEPRSVWFNVAYHSLDPLDPVNHQRARFAHGSALLVDGAIGSFGRYENEKWNPGWVAAHPSFWYRDYELDLGTSNAIATHVTEQRGKPVDLWLRDYSKGIVVVNPSQRAHSIYLGHRYRGADGITKTAFSIAAQDALIAEAV